MFRLALFQVDERKLYDNASGKNGFEIRGMNW